MGQKMVEFSTFVLNLVCSIFGGLAGKSHMEVSSWTSNHVWLPDVPRKQPPIKIEFGKTKS